MMLGLLCSCKAVSFRAHRRLKDVYILQRIPLLISGEPTETRRLGRWDQYGG